MKKLISFLVAGAVAVTVFFFATSTTATYHWNPVDEPTYKTSVMKTENFWIEYSTDDFRTAGVNPDKNHNNIHDVVDNTANLLEDLWEVYIEDLGYMEPYGSAEDGRVLVILDEDYDYITSSYAGMTYLDSDLKPYAVLDVTRALSEEEQDLEDYDVAVAHELFHVIQFGYDPYFWGVYTDVNFSEGSATAMAEYALEEVSLTDNYASTYFENHTNSLYGLSGMGNPTFPYSTYLWPKFLIETYGVDIIKGVFESYFDMTSTGDYFVDMYMATDAALQEGTSVDINEAFRKFVVANYDVELYDDETLENGVAYYGYDEEIDSYPTFRGSGEITGQYTTMVAPFGASYVHFDTWDTDDNLMINVYGQDDVKWMVTILTTKFHRITEEYESRIIYENEENVTFVVENAGNYTDVVMILTPVPSSFYSVGNFDQYYSYSYYVETEIPTMDPKEIQSYTDGGKEDLFFDFGKEERYFYAVKVLKNRDVVEGYKNNTFQPERNISRAEFTKMLVASAFPEADLSGNVNCFKDVYDGWYEKWVCYASDAGLVSGYDDGYFYPLGEVDRATAVAVMLDVFGVDISDSDGTGLFADVTGNEWYADYLAKAYEWGIFDQKEGYRIDPNESVTRGQFADMLYRLEAVMEVAADVDSAGFSEDIDIRDYFSFDAGEELSYAIYDGDGVRVGTDYIKNTDDCAGYSVCVAQESSSGRAYFYFKDGEVRLYKEVTDGGSVEYYDPILVLSADDAVEYSKVFEGFIDFDGYEMELLDVINSIDVSTSKVTIVADDYRHGGLIEVKQTQVSNFLVTVGPESYYGTVTAEVTSYWKKGTGMVKQYVTTAVDFDGQTSEIENETWELLRD